MDRQGFREFQRAFHLPDREVEEALPIAERFDEYLSGRTPDTATAWTFSRMLIKERKNTLKNYLALFRYCSFLKSSEMRVAFLELVDGGEVSSSLYRKVGKAFGVQIRNEVFKGIGVAPYGTPSPKKPAYLNPVIDCLEETVGTDACRELLSAGLRYLPATVPGRPKEVPHRR